MNIRERNVEIFNDTLNVIKNSEKLSKSVETIIKNQKLILDNEKISIDSVDREKDAKIILSKKRTLEAASAYIEKKYAYITLHQQQILVEE